MLFLSFMQVRLSIYILLELPILLSCSSNEVSFTSFPKTEYLKISKVMQIEGVPMRYPFRIRTTDSYLFVMDLHGSEYYCYQFDYPSMHFRQSFAKTGRGPREFLDAENIRLTPTGCWTLDANKTNLNYFQIQENELSMKEYPLDKSLIRSLDFDIYNDSMFIVPDYTGTHRFDILGLDMMIRESRGTIPCRNRDKMIPDMAYAQVWRGFLNYNPQNGILAIATQLGDVIEIYNLSGDSLVNVIYGKEGEPQFEYRGGYAVPNGIMGYGDIQVGTQFIYALFWGHSFKDILKNQSIEGGNNIRVFDLFGKPVRQYILDRYITGFCLDEERGILLGVDVNSNQPVVEWKIVKS